MRNTSSSQFLSGLVRSLECRTLVKLNEEGVLVIYIITIVFIIIFLKFFFGKVLARKLAVNLGGQIELTNRSVYSGFCPSL